MRPAWLRIEADRMRRLRGEAGSRRACSFLSILFVEGTRQRGSFSAHVSATMRRQIFLIRRDQWFIRKPWDTQAIPLHVSRMQLQIALYLRADMRTITNGATIIQLFCSAERACNHTTDHRYVLVNWNLFLSGGKQPIDFKKFYFFAIVENIWFF